MEPFVGEIRPFAFDFTPQGWLPCDGRLLPLAPYQALFALIGNYYGGDGKNNFALPDLRGRAPMHVGIGTDSYQARLAQQDGVERVTLAPTQWPQHSHNVWGKSANGTTGVPTGSYWAAGPGGANLYGGTADTSMGTAALNSVGAGEAHENRQPYLAVNYCIAIQGIFPPRS